MDAIAAFADCCLTGDILNVELWKALTRNISAEMGASGIRVNCIHPGLIDTPMIEWVMKHLCAHPTQAEVRIE